MDPISSVYYYLFGWCGAVVAVLGLLGNAFSLIVLTRKDFRSSNSNLYLIALCLYDSLFLGMILMVGCLDWMIWGIDPFVLFTREFTIPAGLVLDPIILVMMCGSIYTTVVLTIDRCIAVVKPLKWPSICTRHHVKVTLLIVFIWSVVYNVPFCLEFEYVQKFVPSLNSTLLTSQQTEYSYSYFHTEIFLEYVVPIVTVAIPVGSIFIPNVAIIVVIRRQQASMKNSRSASNQSSRSNRLTAQVLFISLFTLTSRLLNATTYIVMDDTLYVTSCSFACACLSVTSAFMAIVNAAVNFVCYCLFGEKFRTAFVESICHCSRSKVKVKSSSLMMKVYSTSSGRASSTKSSSTNQTTHTDCEHPGSSKADAF